MKLPDPGLYRTTQPYPGHEEEIPDAALVYVGAAREGALPFVVRPRSNRKNRWYWGEPTLPLRALNWAQTLVPLPPEGFYTLPDDLTIEGGGRWVKHAIVQLGYNSAGRGILFVAEQHDDDERNALVFGDRGRLIEDALLKRLSWAPILPVASAKAPAETPAQG